MSKKPTEVYKVMILLASVVVVLCGCYYAREFFIPVSLAFFLAAVSFPITNWLREHRVPRFFAVLITVMVVFAFLSGLIVVGYLLITDLASGDSIKLYGDRIFNLAMQSGDQLEAWQFEGAKDELKQIFDPVIIGDFLQQNIASLLSGLLEILQTSFIVLILVVFMLGEARVFGRRFEAIVAARGPNLQRMLTATHDIQKYLGIKTLISIATGCIAGVLCWLAGVDFPLLWGILAFALNYIPAVGSIIAGIPPVVLALLMHDPQRAVLVGVGYLVINGILGNFVEPALLGRRFGLSTVVVFISVLFWGFIWGPVGMLLAVPLTMLIKVALDNSFELRWLGVAISQTKKQPSEREREVQIIKESAELIGEDEDEDEDDAPLEEK